MVDAAGTPLVPRVDAARTPSGPWVDSAGTALVPRVDAAGTVVWVDAAGAPLLPKVDAAGHSPVSCMRLMVLAWACFNRAFSGNFMHDYRLIQKSEIPMVACCDETVCVCVCVILNHMGCFDKVHWPESNGGSSAVSSGLLFFGVWLFRIPSSPDLNE